MKVATLAADSKSMFMAVFTTDNSRKFTSSGDASNFIPLYILIYVFILVFVFTPQRSRPFYTRKNVTEDNSSVLGATFVPHLKEKRDSSYMQWQRKSQLFFLDTNQVRNAISSDIDIHRVRVFIYLFYTQELLTLEPESEVTISLENLSASASVPATAFAGMIADKSTTNKETAPFMHEHLGISGKGMVEEVSKGPNTFSFSNFSFYNV